MKNKKIDIVLGIGFGDEGKGNITNALATKDSLVVQFNGGHQKGHRVFHNGMEHVFSSFGAGTLKGAATYISKHCTVNPIAFMKEYEILINKGITPNVYIHENAMLTIPADISRNKDIELVNQHGSVGVGFGATIDRNLDHYHLFVKDLQYEQITKVKYYNIIDHCYNYNHNYNRTIDDEWFYAANEMKKLITLAKDLNDIICGYRHIVFEGSQGIMLDQHYGFFPNVTRSNTTTENIFKDILLGQEIDLNKCMIYYVSRAYSTRHGNGSMGTYDNLAPVVDAYTESVFDKYAPIQNEETNKTNEYQGEFKRNFLLLNNLKYALEVDNQFSRFINKKLVFTCMDHLDYFHESNNLLKFLEGDDIRTIESETLKNELDIDIIYIHNKEAKL